MKAYWLAERMGLVTLGYEYEVGDIVKLKKQHPAAARSGKLLRVGADFRLKCMGCGHQVMSQASSGEAQELRKKEEKRMYEKTVFRIFFEKPGRKRNS